MSPSPTPLRWSRCLLLALTALLLPACGLMGGDDIGFRRFPLPDVPFSQAESLVRDVTRGFYRDRFGGAGGFTLDWDAENGNLRASPVVAGDRRLRLYMILTPQGQGTLLELFALVETLDTTSLAGQDWTRPQQDELLEQRLYEAILQEHLRRQE